MTEFVPVWSKHAKFWDQETYLLDMKWMAQMLCENRHDKTLREDNLRSLFEKEEEWKAIEREDNTRHKEDNINT